MALQFHMPGRGCAIRSPGSNKKHASKLPFMREQEEGLWENLQVPGNRGCYAVFVRQMRLELPTTSNVQAAWK